MTDRERIECLEAELDEVRDRVIELAAQQGKSTALIGDLVALIGNLVNADTFLKKEHESETK